MRAKRRVGILISGGGSNMEVLIRDMIDPDHPAEPVIVISNRADAGGLARAAALGVPTQVIDHRPHAGNRATFDAEIDAALRGAGADLVAEAGFMRIHDAAFPAAWAGRILNIHPSLLPAFKGLHTHRRALEAGCAIHGCTVHEVVADLDAGPILGQAAVPVLPGDTEDTLATRVLAQEHRLYPAVLRAFAADPDRARANPIALLAP